MVMTNQNSNSRIAKHVDRNNYKGKESFRLTPQKFEELQHTFIPHLMFVALPHIGTSRENMFAGLVSSGWTGRPSTPKAKDASTRSCFRAIAVLSY